MLHVTVQRKIEGIGGGRNWGTQSVTPVKSTASSPFAWGDFAIDHRSTAAEGFQFAWELAARGSGAEGQQEHKRPGERDAQDRQRG